MLDLDADLYLAAYDQAVLLEWVDVLWSCFLEDMDKVKKAVGLKAYSSASPLEEFRTEGNRLFLNLLGAYRWGGERGAGAGWVAVEWRSGFGGDASPRARAGSESCAGTACCRHRA